MKKLLKNLVNSASITSSSFLSEEAFSLPAELASLLAVFVPSSTHNFCQAVPDLLLVVYLYNIKLLVSL